MSSTVKPLGNAVRLEIEGDPLPGTLVNLIRNPNGELGGWGWVTPVDGSSMNGLIADDGQRHLSYVGSGAVPQRFTSEAVPVGATQYVAASWRVNGDDPHYPSYTVRLEWLDDAGTVVATSAPTAALPTGPTVTRAYGPVQPTAPTGPVTHVRIRFDLNYAGPPPFGATFLLREVTVAAAATSGELGSVRTNIIANPSFETNLTGWAPLIGDTATLSRVAGPAGSTGASVMQVNTLRNTNVSIGFAGAPVVAGADYAWSVAVRALTSTPPRTIRLYVVWFGADGLTVGNSLVPVGTVTTALTRYAMVATAPSGAATARFAVIFDAVAVGEQFQIDAAIAEQRTTVGAYFDGSTANSTGVTHAWTGTAHASTSTETTTVLAYIAPIRWVNLLGTTHDVTITRERFNVSSLSALIVDSELDPAQSSTVRPGRLVRVIAYAEAEATWRHIFTGRVSGATVEYELKEQRADRRARITLSAADGAQVLANNTSTEGVRHIDELPYLLENVAPSLPWNCNGNGGQVAAVTIVETTDASSTMDQLALTRDTALGYVWVDRMGTVQAWDRDVISMTPAVPVLDEDVYTDVTVGYDTDACVNEVVVTNNEYDAVDESNTVTAYGPYRDSDSIDEWGVHRQEYSTHGLFVEDVPSWAAQVLAANGQPVLRLSEMRLHVDLTDDWAAVASPHAFLDLYDYVEVTCARANLDTSPARVTSITHTISGPDSKWLMTVGLTSPSSTAAALARDVGDPVWPVELPSVSGAVGGGVTIVGGGGGGGGVVFTPGAGLALDGVDLHVLVDGVGIEIPADTLQLKDSGVTSAKLAPNSVTSAKIADGTIATADVGDAQVTLAKLAANSVDASKIVDGSVGNVELAGDAVTSAKILNGTIVAADLDAALASSIANAAVDTLVVHKAGAETITGVKTLDVPLVQTYQGVAPATPPAGKATGPYFGADGLPYFKTPTGVVIPFNVGDTQAALHLNPSFELWTGSALNSWDNFWSTASTIAEETVDVLFGTKALTVNNSVTDSANQLMMSSVFAVTPGDSIDVGAWARAVSGAPQLTLGIITAPSGTPGIFDGISTIQTSDVIVLGATYAKYAKTFVVPAGHTACRVQFRVGKAAGNVATAVARVDATTSTRAGASPSVLPGNSWPKEAVRAVTVTDFNPASAAPSTVDGQALAIGDRVLKATPAGVATDGIYTVVTVGTGANGVWQRASDASTALQLAAAQVAAQAGSTYGGSRWGTTFKSSDVLGTTAMFWGITGQRPQPIMRRQITVGTPSSTAQIFIPWDTTIGAWVDITYDLANRWFVVPRAGRYLVKASLGMQPAANNYCSAAVYLNGTEWQRQYFWLNIGAGGVGVMHFMVTDVVQCAAGDRIQVAAYAQGTAFVVEGLSSDKRAICTVTWLGY